MKKRLKVMSVCATALLALSPVVAPLANVAHADSSESSYDPNTGHKTEGVTIGDPDFDKDSSHFKDNNNKTDDTKPEDKVYSVDVSATTGKAGTPIFVPSAKLSDVHLDNTDFKAVRFNPLVNIYKNKADAEGVVKKGEADPTKTVKNTDKLEAGSTYYEVAYLVLAAPKSNTEYKINNGISTKTYMSDENKNVTIPVVYALDVQKSDDSNSSKTDDNSQKKDDNIKADGPLTSDQLMEPFYSRDNEKGGTDTKVIHLKKDKPYITAKDGITVDKLEEQRLTDVTSNHGDVDNPKIVAIYPVLDNGKPDWAHQLGDSDHLKKGTTYVAQISADIDNLKDGWYGAWESDGGNLNWVSDPNSETFTPSLLLPVRFSGSVSDNTNTDDSNNSSSNNNNASKTDDNNDSKKDNNNSSSNQNNNSSSDNNTINVPTTPTNTEGVPFFANAQNIAYANNQTINAPTNIKNPSDPTGAGVLAPTSVKNIVAMLNSMGLKAYGSSASGEDILEPASEESVTKQLKAAGIQPAVDGSVVLPTSGFTYVWTATNPKNKRTATLNVFFKATDSTYTAYPLIKFGELNVMQGFNDFNQKPVALVNLNDKNWRADVLKQFSAVESTVNPTKIELQDADLTVTNMDINHTGIYPATLKVTNKDGRSTYLTFNIGVQGNEKDETTTKIAVNKDDRAARSIKVYSIDNKKATPIKGETLPINSSVTVYNDHQTVDGVRYARLVVPGTEREKTNQWVRTDQLSDMPQKAEEQGTVKELMHAAYLYNSQGKRVGKTVLRSYSFLPVIYRRVKIGNKLFYKIANSDNYVKAYNIDPMYRKVTSNAYLYNYSGHIKTRKHVKKVKGKKRTVRVRLYYSAKSAQNVVKTYGGAITRKVTIGKKRVERKLYRIGKDQYLLASKLEKIQTSADNESSTKTNAPADNADQSSPDNTLASNSNGTSGNTGIFSANSTDGGEDDE